MLALAAMRIWHAEILIKLISLDNFLGYKTKFKVWTAFSAKHLRKYVKKSSSSSWWWKELKPEIWLVEVIGFWQVYDRDIEER